MINKKKILPAESIPEFQAFIEGIPEDNKIFVDKSMAIADYIQQTMQQKGMKQKDLADKMGKSEAEVSKILGGMHNLTLRMIAKLEAALGAVVLCTPVELHPKTVDKDQNEEWKGAICKVLRKNSQEECKTSMRVQDSVEVGELSDSVSKMQGKKPKMDYGKPGTVINMNNKTSIVVPQAS